MRPLSQAVTIVLLACVLGCSQPDETPEGASSVQTRELVDSAKLIAFADSHNARIPWSADTLYIGDLAYTLDIDQKLVREPYHPVAVQGKLLDVWRTPEGPRALIEQSFWRHMFTSPRVYYKVKVPEPLLESVLASPRRGEQMFALTIDSVSRPGIWPHVSGNGGEDLVIDFRPAVPRYFIAWGSLIAVEWYGDPISELLVDSSAVQERLQQ